MKKNLIIIASAAMALGLTFSSCENAPSTKVALTTEMDSISYSFGASVGENIESALFQMGILSDTNMIAAEYGSKIQFENDEAVKKNLEKELRRKIDSTQKANDLSMIQFLQGFEKAAQSRPSQASYNFGYSVGTQVNKQSEMMLEQFYGKDSGKEINKKALVAALSASIQKQPTAMAGASGYLMMKSQEIQQKEMEKRERQAEENEKKGKAFLEANALKEGVVTLESGLQYKIITEGTGAKPSDSDRVKCHYEGTLIDGTVFDSSIKRGEPTSFGVRGVIPGWTEILQLMPVGSKWEVYIPYDKAYGEYGQGEKIGPKETLIFQIELLEIESAN